MNSDTKICVMLLVGIPASGKSYFRQFLETFFCGHNEPLLGAVQMWSVCYDNHELVKRGEGNQWKQYRLDLMKLVENVIKHLKTSEDLLSTNLGDEYSCISVVNKELKKPDSIIILIDDNMYYRSMRYEYYKLTKMHNISFAQIFFNVDFQKALKCNSERSVNSRVPEVVIENMFKKLEPPQNNHQWELFSVSVLPYADLTNHQVLSEIFSCLRNALDNPVKPSPQSNDEAHRLLSDSIVHQIDNILKKLVAVHIRNEISAGNKSQLSQISKCYSERRLKLLKQIKGKIISLPIDLNGDVSTDKINLVKEFLSNLLHSDCQ